VFTAPLPSNGRKYSFHYSGFQPCHSIMEQKTVNMPSKWIHSMYDRCMYSLYEVLRTFTNFICSRFINNFVIFVERNCIYFYLLLKTGKYISNVKNKKKLSEIITRITVERRMHYRIEANITKKCSVSGMC
jgi:hypothetical protein